MNSQSCEILKAVLLLGSESAASGGSAHKTHSNQSEMCGSQNWRSYSQRRYVQPSQGTTNRYTLTFLGKEAKAGFLADCCLVFCPINITLVHLTAEVLSEEPILKWYKDAHLAKGKSVFLEQMKKFVEWLKNAEEGNGKLRGPCCLELLGGLQGLNAAAAGGLALWRQLIRVLSCRVGV